MKHEAKLLAQGLKVVTENETITGDLDRKVAPQLLPGHKQFKMTYELVISTWYRRNRKARTCSTGRYGIRA